MNYYLAPKAIAESLGLERIRKSTSDGMYLLSERDIAGYGIPRAIEEGAVELASRLPQETTEAEDMTETPEVPETTEPEEKEEAL